MSAFLRTDSLFAKKLLFEQLLKRDLGAGKFLIKASYAWDASAQLFTFVVKKPDRLDLTINLNGLKEGRFFSGERAWELELRFRAGFLSDYIHCLEKASDANPGSYFDALAALEAICGLNQRKTRVFSPLSEAAPVLRTIDVYCAIRALTRLQLECGSWMPETAQKACGKLLETFFDYSELPEIGYDRGKPVYALQVAFQRLLAGVRAGRILPEQYALFSENGMASFQKMSFEAFAAACDKADNPFWYGAALRMIAYSRQEAPVEILGKDRIITCLTEFRKACVSYSKEQERHSGKILEDNYEAIKRTAQKMERAFCGVNSSSGALHFLR